MTANSSNNIVGASGVQIAHNAISFAKDQTSKSVQTTNQSNEEIKDTLETTEREGDGRTPYLIERPGPESGLNSPTRGNSEDSANGDLLDLQG